MSVIKYLMYFLDKSAMAAPESVSMRRTFAAHGVSWWRRRTFCKKMWSSSALPFRRWADCRSRFCCCSCSTLNCLSSNSSRPSRLGV